jgi:hypothetical protein
MSALTILIIRHAEKAGEIWPGPGLTPAGKPDGKSLVVRGWQRAGSWCSLTIATFALTCCAAKDMPYSGQPDYDNWMKRALANPNGNQKFKDFSMAFHGNPGGLHVYFELAWRLEQEPLIDAEGGEALTAELQAILRHIGDDKFSRALEKENPDVQAAVADNLDIDHMPGFPKTEAIVRSAPKIEFPQMKAYKAT